MIKKWTLLLLLTYSFFPGTAQWRLQLQGGPSFSLRTVNTDSLFSAKKEAFHLQAREVYFWGHLGLGITLGYLGQPVRADANRSVPPSFLRGVDSFSFTGGGVRSIYLLAGPEFCIACGNKIKINIGIRAGITLLQNKNPFRLLSQSTLRYENVLQSKAPFTLNAGIGFHYFIRPHFGIGAMADWHHFAIAANNRDYRRGFNTILILKQKKDFLNLGGSLVYKF